MIIARSPLLTWRVTFIRNLLSEEWASFMAQESNIKNEEKIELNASDLVGDLATFFDLLAKYDHEDKLKDKQQKNEE